MSDKEVGGLTAATTPLDGTELHYVVQSGNSRKVTGDEIVKITHTQAWSTITSTPTTLSGYGITDAATSAQGALADTALQPGDIGSSVQSHDALLDALAGLTTASGDIIYATGSDAVATLGIGSEGQVLKVSSGGIPEWGAVAGTGDVVGPSSSTDGALALFDGTSGDLLKEGSVPGATGLALLADETAEDARSEISATAYVATRTILKALTPADGDTAILTEDVPARHGRFGSFVFDSSDLSTEVTADTQEGVYVAPDSDATGASGAWVRIFNGSVFPYWYNAKGDGTTDDYDALVAVIKSGFPIEWGDPETVYATETAIDEDIEHAINWCSRGATIKYTGSSAPYALVQLNVHPHEHQITGKITFDGNDKAHVGIYLDNATGSVSGSNYPSLVATDLRAVNFRRSVQANGTSAGIVVIGAWELVELVRPYVKNVLMDAGARNPSIAGVRGITLTRDGSDFIQRAVVVDPWIENVFCDGDNTEIGDQDGIALFSQRNETSGGLVGIPSMSVRGGVIKNVRGRSIKAQTRSVSVTGGLRIIKEASVIDPGGLGLLSSRRDIEVQAGAGVVSDVDFYLNSVSCEDLIGINISDDVNNSPAAINNIRMIIQGVSPAPRSVVHFVEKTSGRRAGINVSNLSMASSSGTDYIVLFSDDTAGLSGQTLINVSNFVGLLREAAAFGSGSSVSSGVVNLVNVCNNTSNVPEYDGRSGVTVNRVNTQGLTTPAP